MTEGEKKAIERIEDTIYTHNGYGINHFKKITLYESGIDDIQTVLNLIQKQQEEIEEKDKVLHEMAEWIFDKDYGKNSLLIHRDDYYSNCVKQVIKNFEKKGGEK